MENLTRAELALKARATALEGEVEALQRRLDNATRRLQQEVTGRAEAEEAAHALKVRTHSDLTRGVLLCTVTRQSVLVLVPVCGSCCGSRAKLLFCVVLADGSDVLSDGPCRESLHAATHRRGDSREHCSEVVRILPEDITA